MKHMRILFALAVALSFVVPASLDARPKWKGSWYLRGLNQCKEINLDKKGKTTMGVYPKAIVEKKGKELYLTVESMGKKYSYRMDEVEKGTDYDLVLISVGPNLPVPATHAPEDAYTGMYRMMVDCQTMIAGVQEAPAK